MSYLHISQHTALQMMPPLTATNIPISGEMQKCHIKPGIRWIRTCPTESCLLTLNDWTIRLVADIPEWFQIAQEYGGMDIGVVAEPDDE